MLKRHSGDRFDGLLRETMDCTSRNMHTESLIAIAKHFGEVEYNGDKLAPMLRMDGDSFQFAEEFQGIGRELLAIEMKHVKAGCMNEPLRSQRTALYNRLMELVRRLLTADEYNALSRTL